MTVNNIISKTLLYFKESKETMTPDRFAGKFCEFAKESKLVFEECDRIERYSQRLSPSMQKMMAGYSIKNIDELLYFLTVQMNRIEKSSNGELLKSFEKFVKALLKTIQKLHSKEAAKLAENALAADIKLPGQMESFTTRFKEFSDTYSVAFLNELDTFGKFTKNDLPTLIGELVKELAVTEKIHTAEELVRLLILALTPAISTSVSDTVAKLEEQLKNAPELVTSDAMRKEITACIVQRIRDDNEIFNAKIKETNRIIDSLLEKIAAMISTSEEQCEDVIKIKGELQAIDFDANAQAVQQKLIHISEKIDQSITGFSRSLQEDQSEIQALKLRIVELEKELEAAQKEATEDFLTTTLTRRGLAKKFEEFEKAYQQKGRDYTIVFFDVDHFKNINDTYGHNAGDVILAAIGKFLNKNSDPEDVVGRYGGEEFVMISRSHDLKKVHALADAMRKKIEQTNFVYQKKGIVVTCSAGIAVRSEHESQPKTIKAADMMVYEAKNAGRNTVFPRI